MQDEIVIEIKYTSVIRIQSFKTPILVAVNTIPTKMAFTKFSRIRNRFLKTKSRIRKTSQIKKVAKIYLKYIINSFRMRMKMRISYFQEEVQLAS